jgi:hypothetical protein
LEYDGETDDHEVTNPTTADGAVEAFALVAGLTSDPGETEATSFA